MKLFKEIMCEECGKKTNVLTRTKLADGAYLCGECSKIIPGYMLKVFLEKYTIDEFKMFKEFINGENATLHEKFSETHQYGSLHLDHVKRLFYIDDYNQIVILKCKDIKEYNIEFRPEKIEEGVLKDKAIGKVVLRLTMDNPYFFHEDVLKKNVKFKIKQKMFGGDIDVFKPEDLENFEEAFYDAYEKSKEEMLREEYEQQYYEPNNQLGDINQAMALFMLDSLNSITLDELKKQRNRLIQIYHPDKNGDIDDKYMKKINSAYEILSQFIK